MRYLDDFEFWDIACFATHYITCMHPVSVDSIFFHLRVIEREICLV